MLRRFIAAFFALSSLFSINCQADVSSTVTYTSNYLFNGITLTDHDPALQPSLDWSSGEGWYAGLWASTCTARRPGAWPYPASDHAPPPKGARRHARRPPPRVAALQLGRVLEGARWSGHKLPSK